MISKKSIQILFLLLFTSLISFAQLDSSYSKNWKTVETFEKKGLTRSALDEVVKIFNLATKSGNEAQQVKSAMYQMKYRNMIEEDNKENNIFFIDTLIAKSKAPAKNILQSMQAELFLSYRNNNRYKLYGRTNLIEEKSNDITTWSLSKLNTTISTLYNASLKNESILKNNRLNGLDAIIQKGENTRNLRPTLFDFLAHRALDYFMSSENDVSNPAYKFILNDEKIFSSAPSFINTTFKTKDSSSLYYNALNVFREILKFHINDVNPDALLDADLLRLDFVNNYAVFTNKDILYEEALKTIEKAYMKNAAAAQAMFLRAQLYYTHGMEYDPILQKEPQYEIKRAKELCDSVIFKFPNSVGAINSQNLLNQLNIPFLNMEFEKVNIINQPFRGLIKYKNISSLYFRIIKTDKEELTKLSQSGYEIIWKTIANLKPFKSWKTDLPNLKDYQLHATEIKTESLPSGIYMILASIDPDFSLTQNIIAKQVSYVSNISYISNNKDELYVLDRDNGQPLENASVQLWQQVYNYNNRKYDEVKKERYTTDANGYIKLKRSKDSYNSSIQIKYKEDELFMDDNITTYYYNSYQRASFKTTFLFTDRSIYRPGQTIFFKGIVVNTDSADKKSSIASGYKTRIILYDVNNQRLGSLDKETGEYGSFNGNFKLPEGLLNGNFSLKDSVNNSTLFFRVEEYKRPKFFVEISKPSGTYRVNDSITVKGNAKAYAGNNIDGAKVIYRVVRKVRFPIWWGWSGFYNRGRPAYPGISDEMEITNGETTTNTSGEFFVIFKAIPDETVDKKGQPVFYYEISADITDINGETRSGNTSVAVSYQMLKLEIASADKMEADSISNILIKSINMNGLFEKALIHVSLYNLKSPEGILRKRYWDMPDQYMMSFNEYKSIFPHDIYSDEDQMNKWPLENQNLNSSDSTNENGSFALRNGQLKTGWYKIIVTSKDKYGEEVSAEKYIQLTDGNGLVSGSNSAINIKTGNRSAEPGGMINYSISTDFDKIWLIHSVGKTENRSNTSFQYISNSVPFNNDISVKENDRGGINMGYVFVKNNRVYTGTEFFNIPWSNKDLNISYETFRDKVLPGSEEKWKIKISGNKSEKVAAETLISMYDASLDQFKKHNWGSLKSLWPVNTDYTSWRQAGFSAGSSEEYNRIRYAGLQQKPKSYDALLNNGWNENDYYRRSYKIRGNANAEVMSAAPQMDEGMNEVVVTKALAGRVAGVKVADQNKDGLSDSIEMKAIDNTTQNNNVQIRKNFNETAFFFPSLLTDKDGNIEFAFTIPEALTEWKMMTLAHSKDLASGYAEKTVITQKPLMVQPNPPRFLREGDQMEFSAKIVNMSDHELTGTTQLELFDAATNKVVDGWFKNIFPSQYFTVAAGQSVSVKFPIGIPSNFNSALIYRIKAITKDADFSDGEEAVLPVLTNRMLVTESLPLNMRNETSKQFTFDKLLNSGKSETLSNHAVTVEYTSNPAWYAVQALPFLMEYPYECAEQTFNRYYANTLASFIANSTPKIKAIFETWRTLDTAALLSNLQKNEELKAVLLQETPWVLEAQNESTQKKNIALLFDMVRMSKEKETAFNKLKEMQSTNGGFTWFKGGPDDRYMTQYIITGVGHLLKLNALTAADMDKLKPIISKALPYLDARLKEDYDYLLKYKVNLKSNNLSFIAIQYLYMRSFFNDHNIKSNNQTAFNYYRGQSQKFWLSNSKYMQAMIALSLFRTADNKTPAAIIKSLKENAIYNDEMGMYWKEFTTGGYYWQQAPIESQSMMIEAFTDIDKNNTTLDNLKTWLLKQKQTQNWKTSKATAEACYALLLNGNNWLSEEKTVSIHLGNTVIKSTGNSTEAGTGYFKKTIEGEKVKPEMGNINVQISTSPSQQNTGSTNWGSVYWQYFENLDKITSAVTPLKLVKKLFIEKNSDRGPVLQALNEGDELHIGDKVKVRIELRVDRYMEYIHMKDMRGSCMEPVNVISQYKWQGGLGYYESTKDASTNFFFGSLPRGTYVFEYPMFVTHSGDFSNGITTIQCMYAPEFTSHSNGIRVNVTDK